MYNNFRTKILALLFYFAQSLIAHSSDMHAEYTPLELAVLRKDAVTVRFLLQANAPDVSLAVFEQATPQIKKILLGYNAVRKD